VSLECLEDLDLSLDFALLDRLEDLDGDLLVPRQVDALEDLGVLAPPDFLEHFIIVGLSI